MASKTDTSTAGRSDLAKGIPDPKIKRTLEWLERLLTSVKRLKDRAEKEQTYYCFLKWGLDRSNTAAAKAVASSLKNIGYAGEAAQIRSLHKDLARTVKDMLVRSDPAYKPASEYEMAYLVTGGTLFAANLERALLGIQTIVCRDAKNHPPVVKTEQPEPETPATVEPPAKQPTIDDNAYLSPSKLAEIFSVPQNPLEQRLKRWRQGHADGWIENQERKPREPQYLYRVQTVRAVVKQLKTTSETTSERPAKKL